ncbi:MAG: hypothetical protein GX202_05355 [Firmicutes bacterium]|nr:hypothetical protein [Bacillota bacterium]
MKTEEVLDQIAYLRELITQTRLRAADGYPFFLLWGLLWIVGYMGSIWLSSQVWAGVVVVGGVLSVVVGFKKKNELAAPPLLKKIGWLELILFAYSAFLFSLLLLFTDNFQIINSFWPFQIGMLYILAGIFAGRSLVLIGCWLMVAAVAGIWIPFPWQQIWLAAGGGGGLILTGLLLRKQVIKGE